MIADIYGAYANVERKTCVANIENDIKDYMFDECYSMEYDRQSTHTR